MAFFAVDAQQSSPSRAVLIGVCGVAIAFAIYLGLTLRGGASGQINAASLATPYICVNDGSNFTLTPAQFEAKLQAHEVQSSSDDGSRGGVVKLKCPKCGQFSAVLAAKCPKDGTLVPVQDKNGQPGKCPKCGGDRFYTP